MEETREALEFDVLFTGLLRQIHQMYGTGQIRRATADKEYVKLQCFSGFFHVIFPYKNPVFSYLNTDSVEP